MINHDMITSASVRGGWDLGARTCLATGFLLTMLGENG